MDLTEILHDHIKKEYFTGKNAKNRMIDIRSKENKTFFVAYALYTGGYCYNGYKDYKSFISVTKYYEIPGEERRFFELIHSETKLYFDFDKYMEIPTLISALYQFFEYNDIDYPKTDYLIKDASNDGRFSLHIIPRNCFKFKNTSDLKIFVKAFKYFITERNIDIPIDMNVYKPDQLLRMLYSDKPDAGRPYKKYKDQDFSDELYLVGNVGLYDKVFDISELVDIPDTPETPKKSITPIKHEPVKHTTTDSEKVKELIDILDDKRADEQREWWEHCCAIYNSVCKDDSTGLIHYFSKKWPKKYNKNAVDRSIYDLYGNKYPYAISYLEKRARIDNQQAYNEWYDKWHPEPVINGYIRPGNMRMIKNILNIKDKKKRTAEQQDALERESGMHKKYRIHELTDLSKENMIEKTDKYVSQDVYDDNDVVIVKAGLGKGKTQSTTTFLKNQIFDTDTLGDYSGVIILTPRKSFAQSILKRYFQETGFPFVLYSSVKERYIRDPFVVIQVESLHRLDINFEKYIIILDECESILSQMTSKDTHTVNHTKNIRKLNEIMTTAKKIICLDAFMTKRTVYFIRSFTDNFTIFNYTTHNIARSCVDLSTENHQESYHILQDKAFELISNGKKIFFVCSSKSKIEKHFVPSFERNFPGKKCLAYYSGHIPVPFFNIDKWGEYDVVVTTTIITVGINYDIPNVFDALFLYGFNEKCGIPRDWFQALYRTRHITDNILYYSIDMFANCYTIPSINSIIDKNDFIIKAKRDNYIKDFDSHNNNYPWYQNLVTFAEYEYTISSKACIELSEMYLSQCNYRHIIKPPEIDDKKFKNFYVSCVLEYDDILDISNKDMDILIEKQKVKGLDNFEKMKIKKYIFKTCILNDNMDSKDIKNRLDILAWNFYSNYNESRFNNLCYEYAYCNGFIPDYYITSYHDGEIATTKNLSLKLPFISKIMEILQLRNTFDTGREIRQPELDKLGYFYLEKKKELKHIFSYNDVIDNHKYITVKKITNHILASWGLTKMIDEKKRVRYGKERVWEYTAFLVNSDSVKQSAEVKGHPLNLGLLKLNFPIAIDITRLIKPKELTPNKLKKLSR